MIANKIQTLENYPDDEIQAEIDKIKRIQNHQSPLETYKQIIGLENSLIIKAKASNFEIALKKKLEVEDTLNIMQFYSEDVKNKFLNGIRKVSQYIAQQDYEKAIQKINKITEELNQLRAFRESNAFLEMERAFITLNDNIQEDAFVDQTIKEHVENMKRALDGENSSNFRELYQKTVDKLAYDRSTVIADAIRETLKEQGYEEIQTSIEEHGRFKVRGFKDNKPLTFWIEPNGDFDFDFPEDALEDDHKCHQEIKTVLKNLKIRLKEKGLQLNVIEITRKFRLKKAVKQVVEDITDQAVEETRSEDGTVTIRTIDKERKVRRTRERRKQIE
ncbi:hypothetical protein DRO91_08070 [Candidatus Heimdallarchaeota archaeon]|nr:MAG: hypothetical protein DRO91_08070 [Candidatus Heimdallarchaeota archaeon]